MWLIYLKYLPAFILFLLSYNEKLMIKLQNWSLGKKEEKEVKESEEVNDKGIKLTQR